MTQYKLFRVTLPALGACLLTTGMTTYASPATAQEAAALEEIIVSAQRRAYRGDFTLMETPQTIQILNEDLMIQAGVTELTEALDLSASVSRQNNFGGLWNSFAVRGFAGDENLPSNYLVNGFNAGRGFGGSRDISGIAAVEVLKGPSAALFGRGEPGGAINLLTKRPGGNAGGSLRASADEFGTWRTEIDYDFAPISDRAAVRLVGYYQDGNSFRDTVNSESYGTSPSVLLRLNDDTSLVYELEATRQKAPFDRGIVAVDGELGLLPPSRFLGEPGDGPMTAEVLGHQLELSHNLSPDWHLLAGLNYRDTSLSGFSTEPEFFGARQRLSEDGRTLTRQRRHRDYDAEYTVLRTELSGQFETGALTHRILLGADTDRFRNDQSVRRYRAPVLGPNTTLQDSYAIDILDPVYGQFPLPETAPLTNRVDVLEATGLYIQDQINLTERFQIRLGLRYDDFQQRSNNRLAGSRLQQSDSRISPQFGAVYAVSDEVSLYGSYGEGFRGNPGADAAGNAFDPNQSSSVEAGVKFELLDGDIQGNVALFELKQKNMLSADSANPGFQIAIGEARSRGAELDLAGRLGDYTMHFSYAYVDAESRRDVLDYNFWRQIARGDRLINVPRHSISTQLNRDFTVAGRPVNLGGGLLHVGERRGETAVDFNLPSYTLLRLYAGFALTDNIRLRAELDNALDEEYYPNSFAQVWVQPGTPRRARLSA